MLALLELTTQIVTAHVSNNDVSQDGLTSLIKSVYQSLANAETIATAPVPQEPAVPIRKSVYPDFIICLEDGKKMKMLKRHLHSSFGMTPEDYRAKWNLPRDYPMTAPNYARKRSTLAKSNGLGRKPGETAPVEAPKVTVGRPRKARGSRG